MLKLTEPLKDNSRKASELANRQIAIISGNDINEYIGLTVIRCENELYALNGPEHWDEASAQPDTFLVEVLPNGTQLTVTDNE